MGKVKTWHRITIGVYFIIILVVYVLLLNRIKFGVEFTDESWYVAEPYIVAEGAIPYVNNWSQAPGFALPLAILFKLYVMISGGTEGIVYFSRMLYAIVSMVVYGLTVYIIWRRTRRDFVLICVAPLLFLNTYSLYDLNYNTMGVMYLFLATAILFFSEYCEMKVMSRRMRVATAVLSGIIIARAIIASPSVLIAWAGLLIILLCTKRFKKFLQLIMGNILAATVIIGWCCIRSGISDFISGLQVLFTKVAYFRIESMHTVSDDAAYMIEYLEPLKVVFILCVIAFVIYKIGIISFRHYKWLIVLINVFCLLEGGTRSFQERNYEHIIRFGWFGSIVIAFFLVLIVGNGTANTGGDQTKSEKEEALFCSKIITSFAYIAVLYFGVYLFTSATNVYGFGDREYWLIIPLLLGIMALGFVMQRGARVIGFACSVGMLLCSVLLINQNYGFVYRDSPLAELTERVDYGIWKGCYTTPERADNVKRLETYIHDITDESDNVLFMDQVCFAYLMNDGKACTPATADPMVWTYKVDDFEIMEEYFDMVGTIPDKVIYIDFGRDETLSVDGEWKFNDFLRNHYTFVEAYDTNPEVEDKHSIGDIKTASFYIEYYERDR